MCVTVIGWVVGLLYLRALILHCRQTATATNPPRMSLVGPSIQGRQPGLKTGVVCGDRVS